MKITIAYFRRVYKQFTDEEITMSRMIELLNEKKGGESEPVAYEFHNHETGHCYVDYIEQPEVGEKEGYIKTPLYKLPSTGDK